MSFLTPLFFVALAGLAVPLVIHLIQRERKQVVPFPSLMFLRKIPYQSVRRRHIRHWLLLLVRLAALALVVLAFARPFFHRPDLAAAATAGAREVVILLDRSYSMGYAGVWPKATTAARNAIGALGPADRASIVLFASDPEVALRSTGDRTRLQAAVADAEPTAGATRYGPALKLAASILSESPLRRRETILITDFQRTGWQGTEGVRLPDGATLTPVAVAGTTDAVNLAVTPITLQRSSFSGHERVTVTAGVTNRSSRSVHDLDLALEIGGRTLESQRVQVAGHGSASVSFAPFTLATPDTRGTVRAADDALLRDNTFHFVVSPTKPVRVVVFDRGAPGESLYLSRALSIGDAPRFDVTARDVNAASAGDVQRAAVVILNDVPVSQALADSLGVLAERGGGALVIFGPHGTWPSGGRDVLPAVPASVVDRSTGDAGRLGMIEYGHPVFDLFRAPRTGDFSAARFYGYRGFAGNATGQVLARFDDGAPALIERKVGRGRVLAWASTVDLTWNDLALKPVFLPFIHRIVRYLAAYTEPTPWLTVGQVLAPPNGTDKLARVALTPSGRHMTLDDEGPDVLELGEQGFYEIRRQGRDSEPPVTIASNVDLAESDLTAVDPREVTAAVTGRPATTAADTEHVNLTPEAQERSQRIWWYVLCAGFLLLAVDTLLSNRLSRS
jgi:Aerotolerance regulator N-terminal/von Willebrand factor type A domain